MELCSCQSPNMGIFSSVVPFHCGKSTPHYPASFRSFSFFSSPTQVFRGEKRLGKCVKGAGAKVGMWISVPSHLVHTSSRSFGSQA